jgi:phage N-6-adenine-methyltransferase
MKTHSTKQLRRNNRQATHSKNNTPSTKPASKKGFYTQPVAHSSKTDEWATPQATFNQLHAKHNFGLDVCALQSSAKTEIWYGPDHVDPSMRDGLLQDWTSDAAGHAVWMNPPYGRTIGEWMHKAVAEADKGSTVVCLIPARTDTAWFQDTVLRLQKEGRAEITFVRGRLKFGTAKNSAPFPSIIATLHPIGRTDLLVSSPSSGTVDTERGYQ